MGKVLWGTIFPCLIFGKSNTLPTIVGTLSTFPVKKSGLGLQNPVASATDKYISLLCASYKMIGAVTCESKFQTLINFGLLKRRGGTGRNIGMMQIMQKSVEFFMTRATSRNEFSYVPRTRVPG